MRRAFCHPYNKRAQKLQGIDATPQVCQSIVGGETLLYATPRQQEWGENLFVTYSIRLFGDSGPIPRLPGSPIRLLSKFCMQLILQMYCRFLFPKCDLTSSFPQPQPICREACKELRNRCQREWNQIQRKHKSIRWKVQQNVSENSSCMERRFTLMCCKDLPRRNGANIPECYYPEMLTGNFDVCVHDVVSADP